MNKIYGAQFSNINPKADIGDECTIHSHVWIGEQVKIGDRCKIQAFAFICPGVTIGDEVFIGPGVRFTNDPTMEIEPHQLLKTKVGKRARIGAGAIILPGLIIGEYSVIGAGSVVTRDVPAGETWAGNPARQLSTN